MIKKSELLPKTEFMRDTLFQEFISIFFLKLPGTDLENLERNSRVTYQRYNIETISEAYSVRFERCKHEKKVRAPKVLQTT